MRVMRWHPLLHPIVASFLLAAPGIWSSPAVAAAAAVAIGHALPEVRLTGLNGPSRLLSSYRGKALLINVWASWCGPCRAETASLERLAWRDESRDFAIIGVSTDDYRDRAGEWLAQSHATISHYIDHDLELETLLGASRLPLTVLVNARGEVLDRIYGAQDWERPEVLARLRAALQADARAQRVTPRP